MWYNSSFFKISIKIILVLVILLLFFSVIPFFSTVFNFLKFILSCLVFGLVLYYLFRPIVEAGTRMHIPFGISMFLVFLILTLVCVIFGIYIVPMIATPIQEVANAPKERTAEVKEATLNLLNAFNLYSYEEMKGYVASYLIKLQQYVFQNAFDIFSAITHIIVVVVLTPFALFYFMKDGEEFHKWFLSSIPSDYRLRVESLLRQLDQILFNFFHGQVTTAAIVTGLTFIGLWVIQMPNIGFLAFITFFLTLIPYLGTLLAIIPPVFEGLTSSYFMAMLGGIVMTVIHLIEANIITPQVMMKRLDIHPLTIILLIMASFYLFGVTGPFWITPVYVFLREISIGAYSFFILKED